jgi:hypothetical protein
MVFLVFWLCVQESKYVFVFLNKMVLKIKEFVNASERCFLWLKLDRGSWVHLLTLSRSCGDIKRKADNKNVDMIFITLT